MTVLAAVALPLGGGVTGPGSNGTASASAEPTSGGELTYLIQTEAVNLDPLLLVGNSRSNDGMYAYAIYGALLTQDPVTGEILPGIAESLETDDGLTWVLKLRPGVRFTDGTPFDAEAVQFNWERHADPENNSRALSAAETIAEMRVVDPLTLEVALKEPNAHFDLMVGTQMQNIGSPTAIEADAEGFASHPVGAGPFILEDWRRGFQATFTRNPDYWDAPRPYLDGMTIRVVADTAQRLSTFEAGQADMIHLLEPHLAQQAEESGSQVDETVLNGGRAYIFNVEVAPFDDVRVRQAFAMAIDRTGFIDVVQEGAGLPIDTIFLPESPFYYPEATFPGYDPERAQELFNEVAEETGDPIEIADTNFVALRRIGEFIQSQLSQYDNVEVSLTSLEQTPYLEQLYSGNFQTTSFSYADIDPEPRLLFEQFRSGSPRNLGHYSNPAVDAALDEARATLDEDVRREAYNTVQEELVKDMPVAFMVRTHQFTVFDDQVQGLEVFLDGVPYLDRIWIAED